MFRHHPLPVLLHRFPFPTRSLYVTPLLFRSFLARDPLLNVPLSCPPGSPEPKPLLSSHWRPARPPGLNPPFRVCSPDLTLSPGPPASSAPAKQFHLPLLQPQGSCQSELHRALERLAASQSRTHEDLYIIPIPNCDRNGNFHPKQVRLRLCRLGPASALGYLGWQSQQGGSSPAPSSPLRPFPSHPHPQTQNLSSFYLLPPQMSRLRPREGQRAARSHRAS